ncbi:MAG: sensor histidine kinase [Geodermatophilaceae bacterium]|nr:sensor histidine kinase [Geodermatophilaceae bacterium]
MVVLLVIPLVLAGVLGGLRIAASVSDIQTLAAVQGQVALTQQVASVVDELQAERHRVAAAAATESLEQRALVEEQIQKVDAEVAELRTLEDNPGDLAEGPSTAYLDVLRRLDTLAVVREQVFAPGTDVNAAIGRYSEVISFLLRFNRVALSGVSAESASLAAGLGFLAQAKEQLSVQHAVLLAASLRDAITSVEQSQLRSTEAGYDSAIRGFAEAVPSSERQVYFTAVRGTVSTDRERFLLIGLGEWPAFVAFGSIAAGWDESATGLEDSLRTVEASLSDDLSGATAAASDNAVTTTIRDASIVALLLLFTLILLVLVARSVLRPLLALRASALDVAQRRLPALVDQLRRPGGWKDEIAPVPTAVHTSEDIGQVARAFDEVHQEAVRLATEQAMMRSTVNDMFVNLSRRSQGMVERQLRIIDALESGERDPEALAELFRLDHLATRMRRNNENLLVLAGSETRQRTGAPRAVLDVTRGAISEIEDYQRITIESVPDAAIRGVAVNDLVHLTAELLDNATNFSPKEAPVVLASAMQPDGSMLIEIRDTGIGMSATQRAAINDRLAVPPMVDVSVSRHMGLFVVGRLAARHGISVRMRATGPEGGLTAEVSVPSGLISAEAERPAQVVGQPADAETNSSMATAGTSTMFSAPVNGSMVPAATGTGSGRDRAPVTVGNGSVPKGHVAQYAASNGSRNGAPFDAAITQALDFSLEPLVGNQSGPALDLFAPSGPTGPTGPTDFFAALPPADSSSQGQGEGTPIFQEMRSAWFSQLPTVPDDLAGQDANTEQSPDDASGWGLDAPPDFGSSADEGWQAADQLRTPVDAGTTAAGLPRRRPRAHLVPGGAARPPVETVAAGRSNNVTLLRDAERVRGNLSSYQRGTRRGRHSSPMEDSDRSMGEPTRNAVGRHGELPTSQERQ